MTETERQKRIRIASVLIVFATAGLVASIVMITGTLLVSGG